MLLVLSHLRWDFVFQRPQHLLSRAARDFDVVFFEEPIFGDESAARLEVSEREPGIALVQLHLPHGLPAAEVVEAQRAAAERLIEPAERLVVWYYTPMALPFARHLPADAVVFDKMDELSAFKGASPELLALEAELLARADVVFTGGASMHRAAEARHANIHCFPSSIDAAHFGAARAGRPDKPDQATVGHPRIGFFGVIDERFDVDLLRETAALRPGWQFLMIGPVVKIDAATLPQAENIHWLGGKAYAELPDYLANWDIGWMPFAINEATRFISPTKTPEFLAAGLPVVSTAITDVVRPYGDLGLVEIAATAEETVAAVERLLAADRKPWLDKVDAKLADGSWDRTWDEMNSLIGRVLPPVAVAESEAVGV
jgi:glycosyltransferase involved in cell wall biosynthesis